MAYLLLLFFLLYTIKVKTHKTRFGFGTAWFQIVATAASGVTARGLRAASARNTYYAANIKITFCLVSGVLFFLLGLFHY